MPELNAAVLACKPINVVFQYYDVMHEHTDKIWMINAASCWNLVMYSTYLRVGGQWYTLQSIWEQAKEHILSMAMKLTWLKICYILVSWCDAWTYWQATNDQQCILLKFCNEI